MTGFEAFDVRSWLDGALTIYSGLAESAARPKMSRAAKAAVAAAFLSSSLTAVACSPLAAVSRSQVVSNTGGNASAAARVDKDEVPDRYWVGLLERMRSATLVEKDESFLLPPPLI
jgi:hypothetical protein